MKKNHSFKKIAIIALLLILIVIAIIRSCGKEPATIKMNKFELKELNGQRLF